jgi:hypothetical protein
VTVTVCPPIVTVPVRLAVVAFAAMVSVTVPLPLPLAVESVIQAAPLEAVQLQPPGAVIVTLELVAELPTEMVDGDTT